MFLAVVVGGSFFFLLISYILGLPMTFKSKEMMIHAKIKPSFNLLLTLSL